MRNESVLRRPLFTFGTDLAGNPKLADTMYLMTVGVLLAWSLVSNVISNTMLTQDHVGLFWRVLIVMVVLRVVFHNRFTFYTVFGVFVVANAMLVWEMMFANEPSENALAAVEFISGVVGFTVGLLPHTMAYEQAIVWALCFGMALFVIVFGYLRFNFFMLLGVSVITVALSLNFGFFTYVPSFYAFVICTLVNLVKYLNTKRGKLRTQNSYFALYAIPMILVCLAAAFVMPKPEDGFARYVTTTLITTPLDRATSWIHAMFRPKHFSLAQTGFGGGDRRLGGNVVVNDDVVMRIRTLEPVYLTGNTLDWYTGYSWVNSTSNEALPFEERGTNVELYERATSVMTAMLINGELDLGGVSHTIRHISRYFGPAAVPTSLVSRYVLLSAMDSDITFAFEYGMFTTHLIDVHIGNFRTFSAFHTGILSDIYGVNADMQFLQDKNGAIITESLMPRNTVYRVVHHELSPFFTDISMPALSYRGVLRDALDMLNQQEHSYLRQRLGRGNSEIHNLMATRFGDNGKLYSDILRNYLIPHADRIYEIYTALPENFPQRVVDLARYVTETAENDYERARMIEVYLLRFGYTLTPGNTPIGRDFVEYFLFYQQEGYCTYFASAFVTMARAVGLPARYVEGFNVTGFPDAHGFIDVTNDQGHAWGEVYFEGYGWMRFEPTPGGGGIPATYDPEDNFPAFLHWDDQLWYDDMMWGWGGISGLDNDEWRNSMGTASGAGAPEADASAILGLFAQAVLIVSGIIALTVSARVAWVIRRNRQVIYVDNSDAVVRHFYDILRYLKFFKLEMDQHETALQFAHKVNQRTDFASRHLQMKEIAGIFSKARYSGHTISASERKDVERTLEYLDARMLGTAGRIRYLYYKYILAIV